MTSLKIAALALTALILTPSAAHLFELPGKMRLDRDAYFVVQSIYAGWALFGVPILAAILANGALFVALRRSDRTAARWALASAALIALSLAVFFTWTFPANQATANWTVAPEAWEGLRQAWEHSHAGQRPDRLRGVLGDRHGRGKAIGEARRPFRIRSSGTRRAAA
jgi:hypothetical protein